MSDKERQKDSPISSETFPRRTLTSFRGFLNKLHQKPIGRIEDLKSTESKAEMSEEAIDLALQKIDIELDSLNGPSNSSMIRQYLLLKDRRENLLVKKDRLQVIKAIKQFNEN